MSKSTLGNSTSVEKRRKIVIWNVSRNRAQAKPARNAAAQRRVNTR
jgi:hypothetical protein